MPADRARARDLTLQPSSFESDQRGLKPIRSQSFENVGVAETQIDKKSCKLNSTTVHVPVVENKTAGFFYTCLSQAFAVGVGLKFQVGFRASLIQAGQ